ncbi:MAG: hypothetical protein SCALA701_17400 [Candidatus Scalindua sp.]|nr:MAG: hypothetical protein SCALA701_17400 [Candidatus Scalindua sp.]
MLFSILFFIFLPIDFLVAADQEIPNQIGTSTATQPPSPREKIATKRAALAQEINSVKSALQATSSEEEVQIFEHLNKELTLLQQIELLYTQQLALLSHKDELETSNLQLENSLNFLQMHGPSEKRPYPITLLDRLNNDLQAQIGLDQIRKEAIRTAEEAFNEAKSAYEKKESLRRQVKENLETNRDDAAKPELKMAMQLAQIESSAAFELVKLREFELGNQKIEEKNFQLRLSLLREKVTWIAKEISFNKQDLTEILSELDEREFKLSQKLERTKLDLTLLDKRWADARQRLELSVTKNQTLLEEVEARQLSRQVAQREVTLLGLQLQYIADARTLWNRRFEAFNGIVKTNKLKEWEELTKQSLTQLNRQSKLQTGRLTELRRELVTLKGKIETATVDSAVIPWLREEERSLTQLIKLYESSNTNLESIRLLHENLLTEFNSKILTITWGERLAVIWETFTMVWRYELFILDDRPITVSKVIVALVVLLMGFFVSRYFSRLLGRQVLPRLHVPEAAAAPFQALTFYILILFFTFFALRLVNVPLTVFTVLGGAFAIGVGFGSQNVINNFISGLILFAERPIKVGDLVEVDGLYGIVEHIGARSTRVRSSQNTHIIVPNSSFLQNNVLNWTLSDNLIRTSIKVGVVYGSPTRDVERLIRKAVVEHEKILKIPEPIVLFTDFGNSSLDFEAFIWIKVKTMLDRWRIESDIRYQIDNFFRDAGIVIAFPQRDVHLDSREPIRVSVVEERNEKDSHPHG